MKFQYSYKQYIYKDTLLVKSVGLTYVYKAKYIIDIVYKTRKA